MELGAQGICIGDSLLVIPQVLDALHYFLALPDELHTGSSARGEAVRCGGIGQLLKNIGDTEWREDVVCDQVMWIDMWRATAQQ
jgi:hypothetical protein